ncbi:MAG: retroviral-like aspartic protease family protein [Vicinamibacterales bacterium]
MARFTSWSKILGSMVLAVWALSLTASAEPQTKYDSRLREGWTLMSRLQYEQALSAFHEARMSPDARVRVRAGAGLVQAFLRLGLFTEAAIIGGDVAAKDPRSAAALSVHGDALWANGLFPEAEARYAQALAIDRNDPGARHGLGRSLAARGRLDEALAETRRAIAEDPQEPAYYYTLGVIQERQRDFRAAADTLATYLDRLPSRDQSEMAKWARTQVDFLRSWGSRTPFEFVSRDEIYTVPFRMEGDRVLVQGRVNGLTDVEFAIDTGTDQTILTPEIARRSSIEPAGRLQTAGVGSLGFGFRGLEIARIEDLEIGPLHVRNLTSVIKSPPLDGLPRQEGPGFSPLALGLSMRIDYEHQVLTMARQLPPATYETRLPLRMQRLPIVRGVVNGNVMASLAIDTGGEGTAISQRVAGRLGDDPEVRRVPARVYGSAGWDPGAFLLPFVDISLTQSIGLQQASVVVLDLDAPSALLGFDLGGILGQQFLRHYTVTIDLDRSEVGLQKVAAAAPGDPGRAGPRR